MLANDMHLALRVPNIWYRAEMRLPDRLLAGITLPGVPLFVSGSNGRVAWGYTSVAGDFVDFVPLEMAADSPDRYRTPQGDVPLGVRRETIRVKGQADVALDVRTSVWGPLLPDPLLGKPVAVRWTALDPAASDLALLDLQDAEDVFQALPIMQRAGGPPLNGLLADSRGNIAWTYVGKIPDRRNLDGLLSRSWADGSRGWRGYVAAGDKPRIVNPPAGYLVNANQRMVGREYPHVIGQDFDSGYRAFRIAERLSQLQGVTEKDLLQVQLDTRTEFYRYYQRLALDALETHRSTLSPELRALRRHIQDWDGHAWPESRGLAVLVEFRRLLADAVLAPLLARCRALDPSFEYTWRNMDEPLRQLLDARAPELLPPQGGHARWDELLLDRLEAAAQAV
ncbi:penicillin acylase family protein, partial [Methylogaea oryzae]